LLADIMGQLVYHTSFQFSGTVVETLLTLVSTLAGVAGLMIAYPVLVACS
jgi:hypothetical protein